MHMAEQISSFRGKAGRCTPGHGFRSNTPITNGFQRGFGLFQSMYVLSCRGSNWEVLRMWCGASEICRAQVGWRLWGTALSPLGAVGWSVGSWLWLQHHQRSRLTPSTSFVTKLREVCKHIFLILCHTVPFYLFDGAVSPSPPKKK